MTAVPGAVRTVGPSVRSRSPAMIRPRTARAAQPAVAANSASGDWSRSAPCWSRWAAVAWPPQPGRAPAPRDTPPPARGRSGLPPTPGPWRRPGRHQRGEERGQPANADLPSAGAAGWNGAYAGASTTDGNKIGRRGSRSSRVRSGTYRKARVGARQLSNQRGKTPQPLADNAVIASRSGRRRGCGVPGSGIPGIAAGAS